MDVEYEEGEVERGEERRKSQCELGMVSNE